jgi:hypothetical protein
VRSAIVLRPYKKDGRRWKTDRRNYRIRDRLGDLLFWCQRLAEASGEKVSVLIQHNLKKDVLAIAVERKTRTISGYSQNPTTVVWGVLKRVRKEVKELEDAQREEAKRSSRTQNR